MSAPDAVLTAPVLRSPFFRRGPWHALLALSGWLAAISVATVLVVLGLMFAASLVVGRVLGLRLVEPGFGSIVDLYAPAHSVALVWCVILAVIFQCGAQMWASLRLARVIGQGNAAAGLGSGKMTRPLVIGGLAAGLGILGATWTSDLDPPATFFMRLLDEIRQTANLGFGWPWRLAETLLILQMAILAPVAEELFFRGWIWTELRRTWAVPWVMLATAVPFVLAHGLVRPSSIIAILPATLVLTLARQVGGGVRASMLCHILYNAGICTAILASYDPIR